MTTEYELVGLYCLTQITDASGSPAGFVVVGFCCFHSKCNSVFCD